MVGRSVNKKDEIRAYIKARSKLGCSLKKLMTEISTAFGPSCVSYDSSAVEKEIWVWCRVHQKCTEIRRPKSASRKEIVSKIKEIIEGDARFTVRDIARKVGISLSMVHLILKKHLKERFLLDGCHICWLTSKRGDGLKWPKSCFKCFQNMTKSSLPMSSQVMRPGSIILSPSERLAIRSGPLNTANAQ